MNKERISISQIMFILFTILIIVYFSLTFNPVTPKVNKKEVKSKKALMETKRKQILKNINISDEEIYKLFDL